MNTAFVVPLFPSATVTSEIDRLGVAAAPPLEIRALLRVAPTLYSDVSTSSGYTGTFGDV